MRKLWRRIYFAANRARLERELAEEMEAHRELMPADRRARFGSPTRLREESRDVWSWRWLEQLSQDLAYGARVLCRAPGFTLGAVAVLALGIGVNLAEFQIFDRMIFHRLSFRDADSLLQFTHVSSQGQRLGFPAAAVDFYRTGSGSFDWLVSEDSSFEITVEGESGLRSNLVSANYFGTLGVVPAWGRLLDARDSQPGAPAVVVLGYEYWQAHWGGDPHVIGRVVRINNHPVEIVGVVPYTFEGLMARGATAWLPVALRPVLMTGSLPPGQDYSRASETLYGKLKGSVSLPAAEQELTSLTRELARRQPHAFQPDERIQGQLVQGSVARSIQRFPAIAIFMVMVLLVLFSACANLGNMLLARGLARQREIQIRMSIGAGRARVIRQLMTESLLLAMLGAAAGVVFGGIAARLLLFALGAPPGFQVSLSWQILLAGCGLTVLSALAFGLPSALRTVQPNHRKNRLRQSLVSVQVAVSCLLLIAAGVLAHNGIIAASTKLAFDYRNMIVVYPQLYSDNLKPAVAHQNLDALSARLSVLPGVQGVTAAVVPPLGGRLRIDNLPGLPHVYRNSVAATYFNAMNLPILRGRPFLPTEPDSVVVSESAARAVWPNQDPLGKTLRLAGSPRTVVGVVKDSGANLLADADSVEAYLPLLDTEVDRSTLILHTRGDPAPLMRMVLAVSASMDQTVTANLMRTSREKALESQQKMVTLIGSLGLVATVLAAAGMFALIAFAVAQRRRELGIRIAIGAGPRHVLWLLLKQHARPTAIGALAGVGLAVILTRLVRSMIVLYNRGAVDVTGFAAGLACFALIAALATLSPALRALRIDPSDTLREE